jgi:transcription elongation factor Elf1
MVMANSTCPKCNSHSFEVQVKQDIKGSQFPITFIQCSNCGCVVGTLDYYPLTFLIKKIDNVTKHLRIED